MQLKVVFLISLSESLLFLHRKTTGFYMLILYTAILLNLIINSYSF